MCATLHHRAGIGTTHVLVEENEPARILGYYTLSAAQLLLSPTVRMGRLAVASSEQGKGYGDLLVAHAVARCLGLRQHLGVRVLVVDALHGEAAAFYRAYGFRSTSVEARTLYLPLGKA